MNFTRLSFATVKFLLLFAVAGFSYLMLQLILPYLLPPFRTDIDFLLTKQDVLDISLWRWAFYAHISTSLVALLSGLTQFSRTIMRRYAAVHRTVGKAYIITVLGVSAPTGLVMAFYANGGWRCQIAFIALSIFWWVHTFLAYHFARKGDYRTHAAYMLRSYALTWSAVSLRLLQYAFGYLQWFDYADAYFVSAWLGWGGNWLLVETLLMLNVLQYYFPKRAD
jgi:uncharacterized membrane protein